jgi:hypothetical protein
MCCDHLVAYPSLWHGTQTEVLLLVVINHVDRAVDREYCNAFYLDVICVDCGQSSLFHSIGWSRLPSLDRQLSFSVKYIVHIS